MSGKSLFGLIALCLSATSFAAPIYIDTEADGTPVFRDTRTPSAEEHEVAPTQTYRGRQHVIRVVDDPKPKSAQIAPNYVISIIEPQMDAYITQDIEAVGVAVDIQPALVEGHSVEYRLDGQVVQTTTDLYIALDSLLRGSHTLEVQVVDADGDRQGETPASTTFYQYRHFTR